MADAPDLAAAIAVVRRESELWEPDAPPPHDAEHIAALRFAQRVLEALADIAPTDIEKVVREDFLVWGVYGGYDAETKMREWDRIRNIELGAFNRRLKALLAALLARAGGGDG